MLDKELFNQGNYNEIIMKYEKNLRELNIAQLYWLGKSYYKNKQFEKVLEVYGIYLKKKPEIDSLKCIQLWSIYKLYIKTENGIHDKKQFFNGAKYIIKNCKQEDKYAPYTRTVLEVLKQLNKQENKNYKWIYAWTCCLNPDWLSLDEKNIDKDNKTISLASDKEEWYSMRSKAALSLKLYDECLKVSSKALNDINKFHSNNNIWFKCRIAKCNEMLGNIEESIKILKEVLLLNKHFSIRANLADNYMKLKDIDNAKRYYYEALTSPIGEVKGKVKIIEKIGNILYEDGEFKNAKLNYMLLKKIREEHDWKISNELIKKINQLDDVNMEIKEDKIQKECEKMWKQRFLKYLIKREGEICSVKEGNKIGFIKSDEDILFFKFENVIGSKKNLNNKEVSFYVIESYDYKKKAKSFEAINIKTK